MLTTWEKLARESVHLLFELDHQLSRSKNLAPECKHAKLRWCYYARIPLTQQDSSTVQQPFPNTPSDMKIAVFSTRSYDREFLSRAAAANPTFSKSHYFSYYESHLRPETLHLAKDHDAVCVFVNDQLDRMALENLKTEGIELVVLRCAGYNNVNLTAASDLGVTVAHVPAYSPEAVAEHTVALILAMY